MHIPLSVRLPVLSLGMTPLRHAAAPKTICVLQRPAHVAPHVLPVQCMRRPTLLSRCGPRWDMLLRAARLCVFDRRTRDASKGSKVLRQGRCFS